MSDFKFKVGDRVRTTRRVDKIPEGSEGMVRSIVTANKSWPYDVEFPDNVSNLYGPDELELVDSGREVQGVELDPSDPFENVLIDIVQTNRRKRKDYALDGDPFSNFRYTADAIGIEPIDSVNFNIAQKEARLQSLRANGRLNRPENETVQDTYLDRAVYSIIALAMLRYPDGKVS